MADHIPISYLHECLSYQPETGILKWRVRPETHFENAAQHSLFNKRWAGKEAGWRNDRGYRYIRIKGKKLKAHRIIWAIYYGEWPNLSIDHINGLTGDNRISNLRQASTTENQWNTGPTINNKTGFKGVSARPGGIKFRAQIRVNGKNIRIGDFDSAEEAGSEYQKAASSLHGEFYKAG